MKLHILLILTIFLYACSGGNTMSDNPKVMIETNKGTIEVELYTKEAPITVANFLSYVDEGHYNGVIFHRVIPDFMIQGGGFLPSGEEKDTKPPIQLEAKLANERGTIAMARTPNPNSATSQFFINLVDNKFLNPATGNPGYAVFGKVTKGMEVVDEIAKVQTATNGAYEDWPVEEIIIEKVERLN